MKSAAGVVQLERGAAVVRGSLVGFPPALGTMIGAPIKSVLDRDHSAGFLAINLEPAMLSQFPDVPLAAGVTSAQLIHSFAGPLTMSVPAGQLGFDIRIALTDPAPARTLVEHCAELMPAEVGADVQGRHVPRSGPAPAAEPRHRRLARRQDAAHRHQERARRQGRRPHARSVPSSPTAAGTSRSGPREHARGAAAAASRQSAAEDPEVALGLRTFLLLNEMGLGVRVDGGTIKLVGVVRTAWSNPDAVVDKLALLDPFEWWPARARRSQRRCPALAARARCRGRLHGPHDPGDGRRDAVGRGPGLHRLHEEVEEGEAGAVLRSLQKRLEEPPPNSD